MAIEKMTKVFMVCLKSEEEKLRSVLMKKGILHINDLKPSITALNSEENYHQNIISVDSTEFDKNITQLRYLLDAFNKYFPEKKGFISLFTSTPTTFVHSSDVEKAHQLDTENLLHKIRELDKGIEEINKRVGEITHELKELEPYAVIPFPPSLIKETKNTFSMLGKINQIDYEAFLRGAEGVIDSVYLNTIFEDKLSRLILLVALKKHKEQIKEILNNQKFIPISLPPLPVTIREHGQDLKKELEKLRLEKESLLGRIKELTQDRVKIKILFEEAQHNKRFHEVQGNYLQTKLTVIVEGFIRSEDVRTLEDELSRHFPDVSYNFSAPEATDSIPISLKNPSILKPLELLVEMFGYPNYFAIDPTPYIFLTFLAFFGICLGDVLYGSMLVALCTFLINKYNGEKKFVRFMKLFLYAGISAIAFGLITGSWGGDLVSAKYLSSSNPLLIFKDTFALIDPMAKPLVALVIALFIGVFNQFYGIFLKIITEFHQGNVKNAIYDGVLWYPYLIGALILISSLFVKLSPSLFKAGLWLLILGAIGLVFTQGRNETTLKAKIIVGLVSLYGIVGSYGLAGFVGDSLSYSRLLALGLTTSIIGMAFNIIAFLFKIPYIWPVMVTGILLFGHLFNFGMNIIGAFVHPARLTFLEFFGRFYGGGGVPFQAFSNKYNSLEIVNKN